MQIVFDKVGSTVKPFELESEGVFLKGTLQKSGYHQVGLEAKIDGCIDLDCDRCGSSYSHKLDNTLKLSLRDQVSEDKDDLDIIEFLDGVIDLTYILESEINALKGAYHYCDKCDNSDEGFEIEY